MSDLAIVLIVILALVLIWRGPRTLPRLGEALGRGVREARHQAERPHDGEANPDAPADTTTPPTPDGDRRA